MKKCYPDISSQYRKIAFDDLLKLVIGAVTLTVVKSMYIYDFLSASLTKSSIELILFSILPAVKLWITYLIVKTIAIIDLHYYNCCLDITILNMSIVFIYT